MSYGVTGGDGTSASQTRPVGKVIELNTGNDQTPASYQFIGQAQPAPYNTIRSQPPIISARSKSSNKPSLSSKLRLDKQRRLIQRSIEEAESMRIVASIGDETLLSNYSFRLRDTLQELWELRNHREEDWGDILNTLQMVLERDRQAAYNIEQCEAIKEVISNHLSQLSVDGDDVEQSVVILARCGLQPFGGNDPNLQVDSEDEADTL